MAEEENECCAIEHHCLESDFGSTKMQITSADHSLRLTRVSEYVHSWQRLETRRISCPEKKEEE